METAKIETVIKTINKPELAEIMQIINEMSAERQKEMLIFLQCKIIFI